MDKKSWDKFALVALFQTRQTNSHARIQLHLLTPPPTVHVLGMCTRNFTRLSTFYVVGEWGGAEANLETVLFQTPF